MQKMQKTNRLIEKYRKEVAPKLSEEFAIENKMAVPALEKVVVNAGVGEVAKNKQSLDALRRDLGIIVGQTPSVRQAKKSIATFGIRAGMPVGLSATLRGDRMYSFLDKFFSIVLPRLRDFRGIPSTGFDKGGNYTLGLPEHTVFPEVDIAKAAPAHGIEITIVTSAKDPKGAKRLLELLGCPFEQK